MSICIFQKHSSFTPNTRPATICSGLPRNNHKKNGYKNGYWYQNGYQSGYRKSYSSCLQNKRKMCCLSCSTGFDIILYVLRHTYITNLLLAGVDIKTVQYLAGHERAKITLDIYDHLTYNRPEKILEKVNAAFGEV